MIRNVWTLRAFCDSSRGLDIEIMAQESYDPQLIEVLRGRTAKEQAVKNYTDTHHSFRFKDIKRDLLANGCEISDGYLCQRIHAEGDSLKVPSTAWNANNPKFNPQQQLGSKALLNKIDNADEIFFLDETPCDFKQVMQEVKKYSPIGEPSTPTTSPVGDHKHLTITFLVSKNGIVDICAKDNGAYTSKSVSQQVGAMILDYI